MASIQELRAQDPDLKDLDDEQVIDVVHQTYYPDLERDDVAKALGVTPPPPPPPERTLGGTVADAGISVAKGVIGVPEAIVGLADIPTGGAVGKFLENEGGMVGFRPKQAKEALNEGLSDAQKHANKQVMEAEGLWETVKAAVKNPSVAGMSLLESVPLMLGGGVAARGALALAPKMGGAAAGALGEGVAMAGGAAETIRQQTDDGLLTGEQAGLSVGIGAAGAGFGLLGAKIAQKLGIADVDTMLAGAATNPKAAKGIVRQVLEGAVAEGLLEEMPQSVSEQVMQNMALGRPLDEGVNQAAVLGTMAGAMMGGGVNLMRPGAPARPAPTPAPAPAPAPTPADILSAPSVDDAIDMALAAAGVPAPPGIEVNAGRAGMIGAAPPAAEDPFSAPPIVPAAPAKSSTGFVEAFNIGPQGATRDLYEQAFAALQQGKDVIAGIRDPLIARHKAAFQAGRIRSVDDLIAAEQAGKGAPREPQANPAIAGGQGAAGLPAAPAAGALRADLPAVPEAATGGAQAAPGAGPVQSAPVPAGAGQPDAGLVQDTVPGGRAAAASAGVPAGGDGGQGRGAAAQPAAAGAGLGGGGAAADVAVQSGASQGAGRVAPEALALKLARAAAAVGEAEGRLKSKSDDANRLFLADSKDVENAVRTQMEDARRADPAAWAAYDEQQKVVAALQPGAQVETPDGPGTIVKKFPRNWQVMIDGVGRRLLPPGSLKPIQAKEENNAEKTAELPVRADGATGAGVLPGVQERLRQEAPSGESGDTGGAAEGRLPKLHQDGAEPGAADSAAVRGVRGDGSGASPRRLPLPAEGELAVPEAPPGASQERDALDRGGEEGEGARDGGAQGARIESVPELATTTLQSGPQPLYAQRKVLNADKIIEWARGQGFKDIVTADKLHVTIAFSRTPMDPLAVGNQSPSYQKGVITGTAGREVTRLGDEGAIVLKFASPVLQTRWAQFNKAGASWDFEGYQPHITISYGDKGLELSKIEPYKGPIELGEELVEPLDAEPAAEQPRPKVGDVVGVQFEAPDRVQRMRVVDGPLQHNTYGWAYKVQPEDGSASVLVPESRLRAAPAATEQPRDEETGQFAEKPATPQVPNEPGTKYVLPSFVTAPHAKKPADDKPSKAAGRQLRQAWPVDGIDGYTEMPGKKAEQTDSGLKGGVKDEFLQDARTYLRAVADELAAYGFQRRQDAKGRDIVPVQINEGGPAVAGDVYLDMVAPTAGESVHIKVGASFNEPNRAQIMVQRKRGSQFVGGNQFPSSSATAGELSGIVARQWGITEKKAPEEAPAAKPVTVTKSPGVTTIVIDPSAAAPKKPEPSANKLVTDDMAAAARARLKAKLGRLGSGIDPEMMLDGVVLAAYHVERGARTFAAYAKAMLQDLGEAARPFLKSWYMGVKYDPRYSGVLGEGMSSAGFVDEFDVSAIAAPSDSNTAEKADTGEQDGTARSLDRNGEGAPEGAPPADVRAPTGGQDAGSAPDRGVRGGEPGDAAPDAPGGDVGRGLGAGARATVPAAGGGRDAADAGDGGVQGAPRPDARPGQPADAGRAGGVAPNAPPVPPAQFKPAQDPQDFTIEDDLALGEGGAKTKFRGNVAAIRLLRELETSGRLATADEQQVLAKYVGWGGLPQAFDANNSDWAKEHAELKELLSKDDYEAARRSTRYAHYTSREIIQDGIYAALRRFGFTGGRVLEGGAGVGNFIGLMPQDMRSAGRVTAIEREPIAGGIAKLLYPLQNVQLADFTEFKGTDGYYDAAVGNPPFASDTQVDKSGRKHLNGLNLHNYFFAKEVDMLREGGILAQVVTNYFLDTGGDKARKYIADRTRFLGAIRLPNHAFSKNAGTQVTTDLIFLQKRPESQWGSKMARDEAKVWMDVRPYQGKSGAAVPLNAYFHANPEMMLGDFGPFGTMYREGSPALVARPGQDTAAMLKEAIERLPDDIYKSIAQTGSDSAIEAAVIALNKPPVQEGGYFIEGGKVLQRLQDLGGEARGIEITPDSKWTERTALGDSGFDKIKRLAEMRSTVRALLAAELASDPKMEALRKTLNEQYDAYRKEHGLIGDRATYRVFDDDPDFPLLLSLEHNYVPGIGPAEAKKLGIKPSKSKATKSPIFERRVVEARKQVRKVDNPKDALAVSMAERGRLDSAYIAELLGKDPEDVLRELAQGDKPLLFLDPASDEYVLRDAYLSGNVRQKLQQAKEAGMTSNVRELEAVQPEDVPAHQIAAKIGAPWVPTTVYEDFAKELLGADTKASITYTKLTSGYGVYITPGSEVNNSNKWGTAKYPATELLAALLNNRTIKVTFKDADKTTRTDIEATEMAQTKAQEIKDRFGDWLFAEAERAELLTRAYNDANNNYVTRTYDGSWMTFPGKVPDSIIKFRRHQRNAIARIVQDRTTLLDHVVGAGKTFTIVAAAMELRRTGLARKPMVAVPNHLVKQWAADFYRLYPGANILTATKKDFERINRRRFVAKIATGDWDAVVIAHSSFGFIQPGAAFEAEFNEKQIELIMAAIKDVDDSDADEKQKRRTVKQLEGMKERLENRIERLRDKPMDDLLDFEELGVDQLFVDEAHLFKNLMYQTKLQNVAGLGDPAGAKRAYDMYVKTQQVMEQNGRGQGVVFATGTPVSNSLAEKYHMMRYLMPRQMEELGFQSFDAWANTYADVRQHWMQKVSGDGFKAQNRMSEFVNVHELLKLFDQVADTVTNDDIKAAYKEENDGKEFPLPPKKTGRRIPVSLDKSPAQEAYMRELAARAAVVEARKGPPQKGEDNHLSLMTDARKAAMDIRLVDLDRTEREPGGRIDDAANKILERYKQWDHVKGTQLVFSDLGTPKKHAAKELAEYQRLQAIIAEATDEVRDNAALGDDRAQEIVDAAEDAEKQLDEQGPDWITAVKAALRGFSVYDDLKDALVERGIPEHQVAFIHDYNTDDQKAALFRKVNAGDIRVLLGSTAKMGAGTNVQERAVALHHLDVPWRPSDVEQREGRIERQGNLLLEQVPGFEIEILAYVTKDTLDMRMWQIQEVKLKVIHQLRTRQIERNIDNAFEDMEMSASEMQAAATGNMDLLVEIQARNDIKKLEQKKRSFEAQKNDLISRRKRVERDLEQLPKDIAKAQALEKFGEAYRAELTAQAGEFKVTIDGKEYTDAKEAGNYLLDKTNAKMYARTVEKDGKKLREEATPEQFAAMAEEEQKTWEERAAPLDVEMNGERYTARAKLAEAYSNIRGDRDPVRWVFDGTAYNRRAAAAPAIRQLVTDALADEKIADIGTVGAFKVTVEGQPEDKFKRRALDMVLTAPDGQIIDGHLQVSEEAQKETLKVAEQVIDWASRMAAGAGNDAPYLQRELESVKKRKKELDAADEMGEWPDMPRLEAARAKHAEVLARLAKAKGAAPAAAKPEFYQDKGDPATAVRRKVSELQQAMDAITDEWELAPPVTVVSGLESPSVPAPIKAEGIARVRRGGGMPKAVIYGDQVFLFADQIRDDAQATTILYHEVLGHAGMRGLFGREFDKHLETVATLRRDDVRRMIEKTGMNPADPETRIRAAEEVLAYMAQEKPELGMVQRAIALIRTFLRKLPFLKDMPLSDAELIRDFILPARRFVEGGGPGPRGGLDFAQGEGNAPFYSALSREVEKLSPTALPVAGWTGAINNLVNTGRVKADEVEWSGVREWLQLQAGKVAKAAVLDYLQANGVRVEEVVKGGSSAINRLDTLYVEADALGYVFDRDAFEDGDEYTGRTVRFQRRSDDAMFTLTGDGWALDDYPAAMDPSKIPNPNEALTRIAQEIREMAMDEQDGGDADGTRYSQYTLPGGENYREMLLTLPDKTKAGRHHELEIKANSGRMTLAEREELSALDDAKASRGAYRSNHWSEPNIIAHIRMNERTDAEGKRVLFIEELQSDWAQKGRREGFMPRDPSNPTDEEVRLYFDLKDGADPAEFRQEMVGKLAMRRGRETDLAPRGPFVDKTDAWLSLALKRIVKYAVDGGFERVAFVNGKQSADRYGLSKVAVAVNWGPSQMPGLVAVGIPLRSGGTIRLQVRSGDGTVASSPSSHSNLVDKRLEDVVGKGVAEKVLSTESGNLRDLELDIGGEGMIAFYDKIVPAALNKLLPKVGGGKVGTIAIAKNEAAVDSEIRSDAHAAGMSDADWEDLSQWQRDRLRAKHKTAPTIQQPGFDVTPEMRTAAAGGLPMFAQGFNTRQIQVDGTWRPIDNADGELLHPTFQGQAAFWRLFADRFELDEQGRPRVTLQQVQQLLDGAGIRPLFAQDVGLNNPRDFRRLAREAVAELHEGTPGKLHWWHKTLGTQYNLAKKSPAYKRVFDRVQDFLEDVSMYATEAADKAPSILPKLDTWRDLLPAAVGGSGKKPLSVADNKAISAPINEGTLEWTRDKYGNPIRIDDMRMAAKTMTADEKGAQLVRNNLLAPNVLKMWQGLPIEQYTAMVDSRYENTTLKAGIVWTDTELRKFFNLTDEQIGLYREFRSSVDKSITHAALADMVRFVGEDGDFIRDEVMTAPSVKEGMDMLIEQLKEAAKQDTERAGTLAKSIDTLQDKGRRAQELMDKGYAPLMRFGHYTVTVYGENEETGQEEVKFFGMYENAISARLAAKGLQEEMAEDVWGLRVERGTMNEDSYKLFAGINPETVELFGEMLGMSETGTSATDIAFQAYLKLARNNRSAMKRMIHRKGTAGFSEDVGRVLAGFTYSTARLTSRNLHAGQIAEAVRDIPKGQGELGRQATRLMEYVNNPGEEAQALRGLLFAQYLGGSIASMLVNMTQPFTVTTPYLSQFGGAAAASRRMAWALRNAWAATTGDADLDRDLKKAIEEGIVAPQEVHMLMAQAQGTGGLRAGDGTLVGNTYAGTMNLGNKLLAAWGKPFATAELFNRRVTFVAAYRTAQEQGLSNPFDFAKQSVVDTQFLYNKGNRPAWARGALGATLMTFKTYSISYLELIERMWTAGEPGSPERAAGRRAVFFAAGMLLLVGGAGGLPFVEDVEDLVDGMMQRLGYNWSTKQKKRELLQAAFGKAFGSFLEKGVSGLPGAPIDVSGRLGLGDLIPGTGIFQKKADHARDVLELAGPAGDLVTRGGKAASAVASGELGEAARHGVPIAMRNVMKAVEMGATGQYKDERGYKVTDVGAGDVIAKGIGFQPGDVAKIQEGDRAAQQMVAVARLRESEIAGKWAKGIADRKPELVQEARRELLAWNEKNPSTPIKISLKQVLGRARKMQQSRAQRIEASAPKEVRQEARRLMNER